jgi:hypothetical protein
MKNTIASILILILLVFIWRAVVSGFDQAIENQDTMLCESAKVSGNREYQEKCGCYYDTGDIKCLQRK